MKPSTPTPHNGPDWCAVIRPPTARTWVTLAVEQKDANQQALDRKQRILKAAAIPPVRFKK
jgi:hypothetical protein